MRSAFKFEICMDTQKNVVIFFLAKLIAKVVSKYQISNIILKITKVLESILFIEKIPFLFNIFSLTYHF